MGYLTPAISNLGNAVTQFNGHDNWDSMLEILNADGRQERFWLDNAGDGSGRIRHTWATTRCDGFAWIQHENFADGFAKEMVVARDSGGRLVVAHIGRDGGFYWKMQITPGGIWTPSWYSKLIDGLQPMAQYENKNFSNLKVEINNDPINYKIKFVLRQNEKDLEIRYFSLLENYSSPINAFICPRGSNFNQTAQYIYNCR
jgi:hypothetical protein